MVGWYEIPTLAPINGYSVWANDVSLDFFGRANLLNLLLSFVLRRHVEMAAPGIYLMEDGEWHYRGGGGQLLSFPSGSPGSALVSGTDELKSFLEHSYFRMVNDFDELQVTRRTRRLALALRLLISSRSTVGLELEYLQTWMAFEILVTHSAASEPMFKGNEFKPVRDALSATLKDLEREEKLSSDQRVKMSEMLAALQRPSITRRSREFFDQVFDRFQVQQVSRDDLRRFIGIRDSIAHAGSVRFAEALDGDSDSANYSQLLHRQHIRLTALLERVILAMLDFECDLLNAPWNDDINS